MRVRTLALLLLTFAFALPAIGPVRADSDALRATIATFAETDGFDDIEKVILELGASGDPDAAVALRALDSGDLQVRKMDDKVFVTKSAPGGAYTLLDPVTGEKAGEAARGALDKIRIKNSLRRAIDGALSGLTLRAKDPNVRFRAANTIFGSSDASSLEAIEAAIGEETNAEVEARMEDARASAILASERPEEDKLAAIDHIGRMGSQEAVSVLVGYQGQADGKLKDAAAKAVAGIRQTLKMWEAAQNVWYGISLGSVLLLAAIGLAITFGVMGVINMAHGEMVMLGAYTTYVVQEIIRVSAPGLFDLSLFIALPLAFLVAGGVGLAIERGVIRFLYGRPLETLLATWGISLILQQTVRTIFGPTNREVGNPSWMSGAFELGQLTITWNRLWIVAFALIVFAVLWLVLNKSPLGLQMRAVTQNRRMASAMGIRTPWIDAMTFALGSGIAGIAGVALSQVDNVSPNLGQSYIVDSFLVVVFGGVGNLWGTLVGALSLGVVNKFLEPYAGAVLGKILILVFVILFIQRRPRGLFAPKGRAVEQ